MELQNRTMGRLFKCVLGCVGVLGGIVVSMTPIHASDDFSSVLIEPGLWSDQEVYRRIEFEQFVAGFRQTNRTANGRLYFTNPNSVTSMSAQFVVTDANTTGPIPRAYLAGLFFNDGPIATGVENGVFAEIALDFNGSDLDTRIQIGRCDVPGCSSFTEFVFDSTSFPNVSLGSTNTLALKWNGATKFSFSANGDTLVYDIEGDVTSVLPAGVPFRQVGTRVYNDTGTDIASMDVEIDNVHRNGVLYDNFSSVELDSSRWMGGNLEINRTIVPGTLDGSPGGVLRSQLRRSGSDGNNHLNLVKGYASKRLSADVVVVKSNIVATGVDAARTRARLTGYWYHDGSTGTGGATGDVQGEIRIIDRNRGGPLDIQHFISRCENFDCSITTTCEFNPSFGVTAVDVVHNLSIRWDEGTKEMTFSLDGMQEKFEVADLGCASTGPPKNGFKGIGTRVDSLSGFEEAQIEALFDNVVTE